MGVETAGAGSYGRDQTVFSEMGWWRAGWLVCQELCETDSSVLSESDCGRTSASCYCMETWTDPFPFTEADQAELKLTKMLYPYPNRRLKVPVNDRNFVGVAALRMTAATVLRMALLRKAVDAAQGSDYVRLTHAFKGWCRFTHWVVVERKEFHMHYTCTCAHVCTGLCNSSVDF